MTRRRAVALAAGVVMASGFGVAALAASGAGSPPVLDTPSSCAVAQGSWNMYQGDPSHSADACSSISRSTVTTLRPAWFTSTPGAVSATPTVAGGSVYVGDSTGEFYALDQGTGTKKWAFDTVASQTCFVDEAGPHADTHKTGTGQITSSAAVASVAGVPTVFVGAGASLFAINARTGTCMWAQDTDPGTPSNSLEVDSSPVVDTAVNPPEVLVGNDDNSSSGIAVTGLQAFNARTGALLWKYQPERDLTLTPREFGGSDALALSCGDGSPDTTYCNPTNVPDLAPNSTAYADGCGDVWSSPALDSSYVDPGGSNTFQGSATPPVGWFAKRITPSGGIARDGLVVFGTGNCSASPNPSAALAHGDYADNQGIFALDPVTGIRVWNFVEPYNIYDNNPNEPGAGDDDFGSSAVLAAVPASSVSPAICPSAGFGDHGRTDLVVEGSKSGFAYGLCEASGHKVWSTQISQPGQLAESLVGSIGGSIGSPALGAANGNPTVFFTAAIPLPFTNDGIRQPSDSDTNIAQCPGALLDQLPLLAACPDETILNDPQRLLALKAVNAATGAVVWRAPAVPSYAAASYTGGVVFDPETTGFGIVAYNSDTGAPIWEFPLAAAPASAAAIVGNAIFLGAGIAEGSAGGVAVPPEATGVWSFSITSTVPTLNVPSPVP